MLAALFGIGAGLTLDEFALWIHLEDVYWAEQGRASLDAVVVAALLGGLIVLGFAPFELADQSGAIVSILLVVALDVVLCILAIFKGKPVLGLTGVFVPLASLVGAIRLATPGSPWARRRYRARLPQAGAFAGALRAGQKPPPRLSDAIAGKPSQPDA